MIEYNKEYRVIGTFDYDGNLMFDDVMTDTETFIYCANGYIKISRYNKDHLHIFVIGGGRFKSITNALIDKKVEITEIHELDGEGVLIIPEEYIKQVCTICKAKKQRDKPVSPVNVRDNLPYFKRYMNRLITKSSKG